MTMLLETGQVDVNAQVKGEADRAATNWRGLPRLTRPCWSISGQWRLDAHHLGGGAQACAGDPSAAE